MTFRDKIRKTFKNKGSSSGGSSPSSSSLNPEHYTGRTDIEYYKPHEIPRSKYRGVVDPAHKETLEAYSFTDAFATMRRRSSQALSGIVSPGGTKAQSRRTSYVSRATRGSVSSTAESDKDGLSNLSRAVTPSVQPPSAAVPRTDEGSDEDTDGAENSLSKDDTLTVNSESDQVDIPTVRLDRTATVNDKDQLAKKSYEKPFSAEELERAMTKVNMHSNENALPTSTSILVH